VGVEILIIGGVSTLLAVGSFGGAVHETLKLTSLRALFDQVIEEPVPDSIMVVFESLGGDDDGDQPN
jgi:hypothetical protein